MAQPTLKLVGQEEKKHPLMRKTDWLYWPLLVITPKFITPNAVSYIRGCLLVPITILMWSHIYRPAGFIFIAAAILDGLDGALARYRGPSTPYGSILDPNVDKVTNATVWLCFLRYVNATFYKLLMLPILVLDGLLFTVANTKYLVKFYLPSLTKDRWLYNAINVPQILENVKVDSTGANWAGKTKMVLQVVTLSALLIFNPETSTRLHDYLPFLPKHLTLLEISYVPMVLCSIFGALSLWGHSKAIHFK